MNDGNNLKAPASMVAFHLSLIRLNVIKLGLDSSLTAVIACFQNLSGPGNMMVDMAVT